MTTSPTRAPRGLRTSANRTGSGSAGLRTLARRPLVCDVRPLGRRPGTALPLVATVPAPADVGTAVLQVPPGSPLELDLLAEAVVEGVLVTGTVTADLVGECARCLDPLKPRVTGDVQVLFTHDADGDEGDGDVVPLDGELADLEPAVRDALVLDLPLAPVCRKDCPGLCAQCGERLEELPADHAHETTDPRWAALAHLSTRPTTAAGTAPDDGAPGAQEE